MSQKPAPLVLLARSAYFPVVGYRIVLYWPPVASLRMVPVLAQLVGSTCPDRELAPASNMRPANVESPVVFVSRFRTTAGPQR